MSENKKDKAKGTGRTTGIALGLIGAALRSSGKWCTATDHCEGQEGMDALQQAVALAADKMSLKIEVKLKPGDNAVMVRTAWTF
jgi:hypothetical protein